MQQEVVLHSQTCDTVWLRNTKQEVRDDHDWFSVAVTVRPATTIVSHVPIQGAVRVLLEVLRNQSLMRWDCFTFFAAAMTTVIDCV